MKTVAIIAEYNPLHAGHARQLALVRERAGADYVLVLMSGDFVQRGEPAIFDKYVRAKAALDAGADLVLELPVAAATGSARRFAEGAVATLSALGVVDELWFGSEAGRLEALLPAAEILADEPAAYRDALRENLAAGLSYPAAQERAARTVCPDLVPDLLASPNNILGIEYCIALKKAGSPIRPRTHARTEGITAAGLRAQLLADRSLNAVADGLPAALHALYEEQLRENALLTADDFSSELRYQLLHEDETSLPQILDISPDFARRIIRHMHEFRSFTQFAELLDTRDRTRTACMRALLHILLGITADDLAAALHPAFVRMLALGDCAPLLSRIKEKGGIAPVANPAGAHEATYARDLFASNLYASVLAAKSGRPMVHDFSVKLIR